MRLRDRAKGLYQWGIRDPASFWIGLLAPLAAWLLLGLSTVSTDELRVRIAGFAVFGVGIWRVAQGIRDTRRLFNRPAIHDRLGAWARRLPPLLSRFPARRGATINVSGSVALSGTGTVTVGARANATLDERMSAVEQQVGRLRGDLSTAQSRIAAEEEARKDADAKEQAERVKGDNEVRRQVEDLGVGNIDSEVVGVWWLIVGELAVTFPEELAPHLYGWW